MPVKLSLAESKEFQFQSTPNLSLQPNEVRIQTHITGIRQGYDLNCILEKPGFQIQQYPWFPSSWGVGEIVELGSKVNGCQVGDLVHGPMNHAEMPVVSNERLHSVGVLRKEFTVYMEPGIVALNAVRQSYVRYGDRVAVFGLGTVGLLAVQYLLLSGVHEIIAIDPLPNRIKTAQRLGAHKIIPLDVAGFEQQLNEVEPMQELDAIYDFSGSNAHLVPAIESLRPGGTFVSPNKIDITKQLNERISKKSLRIVNVNDHHYNAWIEKLVYNSLASKKVIVWPIPCQSYPFSEAPVAYEQIQTSPETHIKVILVY